MQFLVIVAYPKPSSDEYGRVDGAYISCWVDEIVPSAAEAVAREFIDGIGWDVDEIDTMHSIDENTYGPGDLGRTYTEQARIDGVVIRIHTWHIGAPEE